MGQMGIASFQKFLSDVQKDLPTTQQQNSNNEEEDPEQCIYKMGQYVSRYSKETSKCKLRPFLFRKCPWFLNMHIVELHTFVLQA